MSAPSASPIPVAISDHECGTPNRDPLYYCPWSEQGWRHWHSQAAFLDHDAKPLVGLIHRPPGPVSQRRDSDSVEYLILEDHGDVKAFFPGGSDDRNPANTEKGGQELEATNSLLKTRAQWLELTGPASMVKHHGGVMNNHAFRGGEEARLLTGDAGTALKTRRSWLVLTPSEFSIAE